MRNSQEIPGKSFGSQKGSFDSGLNVQRGASGSSRQSAGGNSSVGNMNLSAASGFGSDVGSNKSGANPGLRQQPGAQEQGIAQQLAQQQQPKQKPGVEELGSWLKTDSNQKYEHSLSKLGLDISKI